MIRKSEKKKLEKAVTVISTETPHTEGGYEVQGSVDPRFVAGLSFSVHLSLEVEACSQQEGVNREKLTVKKKIINNEMFFFTVYVPYKP